MSKAILKIENLTVRAGNIVLLDKISFDLHKGRSLGIVGESGSGKSMTAWAIMGLLPEGVQTEQGSVKFNGVNLLELDRPQMRRIRGKKIAMIFQNPQAAMNPVRRIGKQMDDVIRAHFSEDKKRRRERMLRYLNQAELNDPERILSSYPHQLSGGMLQRVLIAMALSLEPQVLIADEPTTALDATIQAQILELLQKLQKQSGLAMIVISHHFGVVTRLCNEVIVMYGGRISEYAETENIVREPFHPYTKALLRARPSLTKKKEQLYAIPGIPPSAGAFSDRCKFEPRCPQKFEHCCREVPPLIKVKNRRVACFLYESET